MESLELLVMAGSSKDIVISPWQSAWYGFYENGSDTKILQLEERAEAEASGYKYLFDHGKIIRIESGLLHTEYLSDENWFKNNLIQYIKD